MQGRFINCSTSPKADSQGSCTFKKGSHAHKNGSPSICHLGCNAKHFNFQKTTLYLVLILNWMDHGWQVRYKGERQVNNLHFDTSVMERPVNGRLFRANLPLSANRQEVSLRFSEERRGGISFGADVCWLSCSPGGRAGEMDWMGALSVRPMVEPTVRASVRCG